MYSTSLDATHLPAAVQFLLKLRDDRAGVAHDSTGDVADGAGNVVGIGSTLMFSAAVGR